jgi:uncharacterized protein (TIGR02145 family)/prepilin-type N-terminal cleavage/methylation domain-containing protein
MVKIKKYFLAQSGFTLVELMVVIAIIGALVTFSIISFSGTRVKSRDTQRVVYIDQINSALEIYFQRNGFYPTFITAGKQLSYNGVVYLDPVPSNPSPKTDGSCPNQDFTYSVQTGNSAYVLGFCLAGSAGRFSAGVTICDNSNCKPCGQYSMSYGGVTYNTVAIGKQCWLDKPLNYGTLLATGATATANNGIVEKYCPKAHGQLGSASLLESDCTTYGAIYPWYEAMNYQASECNGGKCQGICPAGWHIPTDAELNSLDQYLTDAGQTCNAARGNGVYDCSAAGTKLKAGGSTGFNMIIAGYRLGSGDWYYRGTFGVMMSSTAYNSDYAWTRLFSGAATTARQYFDKTGGNSVRCLKN